MRAAVAMVTAAAFFVAGCSKAVRVPNDTLKPATEWNGLHRVTTTTDEYTTREFSITDSTLVITRLGGSDSHYGRIKTPVIIPLADVRSVDRLENDHVHTGLFIGGVLLVAGGIAVALAIAAAMLNIN
jgi:hypothetical protein